MGERGTCIHRIDLLKSQLQNKQQALQFSIGLGKKEIQQNNKYAPFMFSMDLT